MVAIEAFRTRPDLASLNVLPAKRDWMDETYARHAYHCFPVSLTNTLGWYLSFPEDIVFIWDGISDSSPDHVKILKGDKYAYSGRANGTISFNTGIIFKTQKDISLLSMPAPNFWIDGATPFTTLISTSFFAGELPCAWRITRPNTEITIPAGYPIISVLPISLSSINNSEILFKDLSQMDRSFVPNAEYSNAVYEMNRRGEWSDFYRNATDHKGNKIGEHEVKSIRLKVVD